MTIAFAVLAILIPHSAAAWSAAGHRVIAALAWRELSPDTKTKVTEILKSHPDFAKWSASFTGQQDSVDLPAFVFQEASVWADQIRRRGNKWDHQHWHYVDWPLKPPAFPMEQPPAPGDDVIYGLGQCQKFLTDPKATPEERAVYLAWLLHLVGDIHQPLHCVSLFTENYPNGDKGGNSTYIKPASRGISLHSFWDQLLGASGKPQERANYAVALSSQYPRASLKEIKQHTSVKDWSLEGRSLAIEKAYLHGELKGGTSAETAEPLPEGYTKAAKAVGERQGALAGYRLADQIKELLPGGVQRN